MTVVGGKLTTYRRMAQDAVDKALTVSAINAGPCRTKHLPLLGAATREQLGWVEAPPRLVRRFGAEAPAVLANAIERHRSVRGRAARSRLADDPRHPRRDGLRRHPRGRHLGRRPAGPSYPHRPRARRPRGRAPDGRAGPRASARPVRPSSSSTASAARRPERRAPWMPVGVAMVAGDEDAVAEVDVATAQERGAHGRPGLRRNVAGHDRP